MPRTRSRSDSVPLFPQSTVTGQRPACVDELAYLKERQLRKLVGLGSAAVLVVLIFAGAPSVAGYLIIPAVVLTIAAPWFARWI